MKKAQKHRKIGAKSGNLAAALSALKSYLGFFFAMLLLGGGAGFLADLAGGGGGAFATGLLGFLVSPLPGLAGGSLATGLGGGAFPLAS